MYWIASIASGCLGRARPNYFVAILRSASLTFTTLAHNNVSWVIYNILVWCFSADKDYGENMCVLVGYPFAVLQINILCSGFLLDSCHANFNVLLGQSIFLCSTYMLNLTFSFLIWWYHAAFCILLCWKAQAPVTHWITERNLMNIFLNFLSVFPDGLFLTIVITVLFWCSSHP